MDLNLEPLAAVCSATGTAFADGDRVVSYLLRGPNLEVVRRDVLADRAGAFAPAGPVVCRWIQVFKARPPGENADRRLKLTAENLFFALIDPLAEATPESRRFIQFLALMLERKKVLRPRGRAADGGTIYEHAGTKQRFEIATDELTPAAFVAIQRQLGVLVGEPKPKPAPASAAEPAAP
ncbi:MAG: hypothetical protein ACREFX_02120 [Opitutaceae bacterium]